MSPDSTKESVTNTKRKRGIKTIFQGFSLSNCKEDLPLTDLVILGRTVISEVVNPIKALNLMKVKKKN